MNFSNKQYFQIRAHWKRESQTMNKHTELFVRRCRISSKLKSAFINDSIDLINNSTLFKVVFSFSLFLTNFECSSMYICRFTPELELLSN